MTAHRVDGWAVNRVEAGTGGERVAVFRQVARTAWIEEGPAGGPARFRFREVGRDDWSVYLHDASRAAWLQLDLHTRRVTSRVHDATYDLYEILEAEAEVNGLLANHVEFGQPGQRAGFFRQIGPDDWAEYGADGGTPLFRFDETNRDDWSVYLHDASRGASLQLDLHTKRINYQIGSSSWTHLYNITHARAAVPGSLVSDEPASLTFANTGKATIEVLWIDFIGNEVPYKVLRPGQEYTQTTYISHIWVAREIASRRRFKTTMARVPSDRVEITTDGLRSTGGVPVTVTYKSLYPRAVDLVWIDPDGSDIPITTLKSARAASFAGASGDVITCIEGGRQIEVFILGTEPEQYREVTTGPARRPNTTIEFRNASPLRAALHLVNKRGKERRYRTLDPGEIVVQPAVAGEEWRIRDAGSKRLMQSARAARNATTVTILSLGLRSESTESETEVTFGNRTSLAGRLVQVAADGSEQELGRIDPGRNLLVRGHAGDVWRFREINSGAEIGVYIGTTKETARPRFRLRSAHSRWPSRLSIRNRTLLSTEVFWVDADGNERPQGELPPLATRNFETFVTHPWVVRERHSGIVLDVLVGRIPDEVMPVDTTDLARLATPDVVDVEVFNDLGFTCEVCPIEDPGGPPLATIAPGASTRLGGHRGRGYAFREPISRGVFETYMCTDARQQRHRLVPATRDSGLVTTIEFSNESSLTVDVMWVDAAGTEHHYATLESREAYTQGTSAGSMWLVRETRTRQVVGCTRGFGVPQRLRVTSGRLYSQRGDTPVELELHNTTGMDVDVRWVAYDGTQHPYGTIRPGGVLRQGTYATHVWRITKAGTQAHSRIPLQNHLISRLPQLGRPLRPGEVALFGGEHQTGGVAVAHGEIDDLPVVGVPQVSSLRLGVGTGLIAYRDPAFQGPTDVFHADTESLNATDVGINFGSFEVFTVVPSAGHVNRVTSDLARDYQLAAGGRIEEYSAYRTVVNFTPEVEAVVVRATEEITVNVGGRSVTLYPDRDTVLTPTSARTLMVVIPAEQIGTPSLMMRTNTMPAESWFFVFPDATAVQRLREKPDGEFWNERAKLGIDESQVDKETCDQVQKAVQQMTKAIPDVGAYASNSRVLDIAGMDFAAWSLDLSTDAAGGAKFRPLSNTEAARYPVGQILEDQVGQMAFWDDVGAATQVVTRPIARTASDAGTALDTHLIQPATETAGDAIDYADREIIRPTAAAVDEHVIEPAEEAIEFGTETVRVVVDQAGEFVEEVLAEAGEALEAVANVVLAVTLEVGGKLVTTIVDTAEKVWAVVTVIVERIGVAIEAFVDFLVSIFDWDEILKTHDVLLDAVRHAFDNAPSWLKGLKRYLENSLKEGETHTRTAIQSLSAHAGLPAASSTDATEAQEGDWLLALLVEGLETHGGNGFRSDGDITVSQSALDSLERAASGLGSGAELRVASALTSHLGPSSRQLTPEEVPGFALRIIATVLAELSETAFEAAQVAASGLIDIIAKATAVMRDLAFQKIEIPILSTLYEEKAGEPLTLASAVALLAAFPANAIGNALLGEGYRPQSVLALDVPATDATRRIFGGVLRLLRATFATFAVVSARKVYRAPTVKNDVQNAVASVLLVISDVVAIGAHWCDFPASSGAPGRVDADESAGELLRAAWWLTWIPAFMPVAAAALRVKGGSGARAADKVDRLTPLMWLPPVALCVVGASLAVHSSPEGSRIHGRRIDVALACAQGCADMLGVPNSIGAYPLVLFSASAANVGASGLLFSRAVVP